MRDRDDWHHDRVNTETTPAVPLIDALEEARDLLRATTLPLATASAPQQRETAARAVAQLDDLSLIHIPSPRDTSSDLVIPLLL